MDSAIYGFVDKTMYVIIIIRSLVFFLENGVFFTRLLDPHITQSEIRSYRYLNSEP